ncbi:hypothetical protein CNMCM5793_005066 [Aspergillus hiratsukae]|uniref:Uncharacterized protein n=1 Tax=Aspergillus hiratsukae TaxID=1194566 RepID=A0A8H6PG11_9EURO|nr:hypothetical protein CNMCM5793_005066 [Aspergillus hiratsukae]KAF7164392.1 hypothetical protein CNMCM6106_000944 [Aspergillus hiratsukae]
MGRFSFSPGVCPSQWTYYDMRTEILHGNTQSTAFCCSRSALAILLDSVQPPFTTEKLTLTLYSGFDLSLTRNFSDRDNFTASCTRVLTRGETITGTLSHGKGPQVLFTAGIQAHQAWAISWSASDTATMSPSLPDLTNVIVVPTWVPGETINPSLYEGASGTSDGPRLEGVMHFVMIGIPIIGVAIIALGIWCWCCRGKREERQQRGVSAKPQGIIDTTAAPPYTQ